MIVVQKVIEIKLGRAPIQRVLYLYPSFNQTFCTLIISEHSKNSLIHFDKNGKLLKQIKFDRFIDSTLQMISDYECVLFEVDKKIITIINLRQNYKVTQKEFDFLYEDTYEAESFSFSESRILCVIDKPSRSTEKRDLRLTFFTYDLQLHGEHIIANWTDQMDLVKVNDSSRVCWFERNQGNIWKFFLYDFFKKVQDFYEFPNGLQKYNNNIPVNCEVNCMWQLKAGQFLFVCSSNRPLNQKQDKSPVNNNYVVDVNLKQSRQMKITFEKYQQFMVDIIHFGNTSMWKTVYFTHPQPDQTPVYYVSDNEQLICIDQWISSQKNKYTIPGSYPNQLIDAQYQNGDVTQFKITIKQVVSSKEAFMFLMLNIYEDFDFDLMMEALQLLECK